MPAENLREKKNEFSIFIITQRAPGIHYGSFFLLLNMFGQKSRKQYTKKTGQTTLSEL